MQYNHQAIEGKWQKFWVENKTFKATEDPSKEKFYALDMFPFPSGAGLHVGHPLGYTATDIISRKARHEGKNVLHPMGWDAFGLPAENYAIKTGAHPAVSTAENEANFKRQIQSLGFSYDWDRCFSTTDPDYFKWSQWIFLQLYHKGLAYEEAKAMNWCPSCKVVCANEEVEQGVHERCGTPVEKRNLKQWMFKITEYADRLIDDLDELPEWPSKIVAMQKNWIGRSEGCEVDFTINDETIRVYTTRPDTLFGVNFFVLSPEHPLVDQITTDEHKSAVEAYQSEVSAKSDLERTELNKDKTGVFTGAYAINPVNGEKVPVWIADYVLMSYGTGAVMAVPGHDERDFEFAKKFDLPITRVIEPTYVGNCVTKWFSDHKLKAPKNEDEALALCLDNLRAMDAVYGGSGQMMNSDWMDGMENQEAKEKMIEWLEENKKGERKTNYKLRDWIFTRQRYWGEPIPLVFDEDGKCYPLDESELPVKLPDTPNYEPSADGQSPLAKIDDWVNVRGDITDDGNVKLSENGSMAFTRETSTMPNWAGSSWYWLRFMDPDNKEMFCAPEKEQFWGPVDLYVGGAEHAVLHLLYARFWHKVLFDLGYVSTKEPFKKLVNQGMIQAEDGRKMSKSLGNVVNPDDVVEEYGADTLRCYEMFMGPFEQSKAWNMKSAAGIRKWLERVVRVFEKASDDAVMDKAQIALLHKTIKQVGEGIDNFKFNTAISQMMVLTNELTGVETVSKGMLKDFALILSPFAPHLAEELWQQLGHTDETMAYVSWPEYDPAMLVEDSVTYAVQVNGKLRAQLEMPKDADKEAVLAEARALENVAKWLEEGTVRKEIFVPGKIVGFVVN